MNTRKRVQKRPYQEMKDNGNSKFHCGQFDDGTIIVKTSWIKKKISAQDYLVHYPSVNANAAAEQEQSKCLVGNWRVANATIECSHDTIIEAREHSKSMSEEENMLNRSARNLTEEASEINELEKDIIENRHEDEDTSEDETPINTPLSTTVNTSTTLIPVNESVIEEPDQQTASHTPFDTVFNTSTTLIPEIESVIEESGRVSALNVAMIDNINDLEDAKNILKLMLREIHEVKASFQPMQTSAPQSCSVNNQNLQLVKIAKIEDFKNFINKINENTNYMKDLVRHWKKLKNNSRQNDENAKIYNILNELFDQNYLLTSVKWGKPFEKDNVKDDHVYIKLCDELLDIILKVYGLERSKDSIDQIGKLFKNVIGNKIKREGKKL